MNAAPSALSAWRTLAIGLALVVTGCSDDEISNPEPTDAVGDAGPPAVLVVNGQSETLSRLLIEDGTLVVQAAVVGTAPNRIRSLSRGRSVLVTSSGTNELQILSGDDLRELRSIDLGVGRNPWLADEIGDSMALVTNWASSDVAMVDLANGTVGSPLTTWSGPEGFVARDGLAYVACTNFQAENSYGEGRIDIVDLTTWTIRESVVVGMNPQDVAIDLKGRIHVLCTGNYQTDTPTAVSGSVHVLSALGEPIDVIDLGGSPGRIVVDSQGVAWVAGFGGGVRRYDTTSLEVLPGPAPPLDRDGYSAVDVDPVDDLVYFTNFDLDLLVAVDRASATVADTWVVGDGPVDVRVVRAD